MFKIWLKKHFNIKIIKQVFSHRIKINWNGFRKLKDVQFLRNGWKILGRIDQLWFFRRKN